MPNITTKSLRDFYKTTPMREGVLNWYPLTEGSTVLERSSGALTPLLRSRCDVVVSCEGEYRGKEKFDYVVSIDPDEITINLLTNYHAHLKPGGRLLLAFENPYGLQFFSGKRNPRTQMPYTFQKGESRKEVEIRLKQAGFSAQKWYYPFTNHYFAREVYSQNYLPNEFLNFRGHIFTEDEDTKEFDERGLWKEVIRNGAFEFMCCSYLVEARVSQEDQPCNVDYAAITAYREPAKAFITTLCNNGMAYKHAVFGEGKGSLRAIADNHAELARLGVNTLPVSIKNDVLEMKRLDLPTLWDCWAGKLVSGKLIKEEVFRQFDSIRESIYIAAKNGRCYWELVPANCFIDESADELIFFDQEYYWDNADPDIAVARALHALIYAPQFTGSETSSNWLSDLKKRYSLTEKWSTLAPLAHKETRNLVFNDAHTKPIEDASRCTSERLQERFHFREKLTQFEQKQASDEAWIADRTAGTAHPIRSGSNVNDQMRHCEHETNDTDIGKEANQGKVSMVVPCYNKENYISAMLDSVLAQEWDKIELLLINDGSTDGTREIITEYLPKFLARGFDTRLIDQENGGCCKAVHTGLINMTGDYFCLVDADDEIEPQYVSRMAGWLDNHSEYDWAACNLRTVEKIDGAICENPKDSGRPFTPDTDNMLMRYIFREMTTTVWIYMTRIGYLKKCEMIENFCTEHRRVYEPLIAVPLMASGGKLKYFDEALYRYNVYASDLFGFDDLGKAKEYYNDYDYLYQWSISRLNISDNEKNSYRAMAKLAYYYELFAQLPYITKRRSIQLAEQTIAEFNELYGADIDLTATKLNEQGYQAFFAALSQALITPDKVKWKRIIGYGALGKMAKYLLPKLENTAYHPTVLWDGNSDGDKVLVPDLESLSTDDLILVFPKAESAVLEIETILTGTPATVYYYKTIEYILNAARFPQVKTALGE